MSDAGLLQTFNRTGGISGCNRNIHLASMSKKHNELGCCSFCGTTITASQAIITYDTDDGTTGIWAECPKCDEIVDPENSKIA